MHRNDHLRSKHIHGNSRVGRPHGKVVTDGQQGKINVLQLGQQLHIREEGGITGKINTCIIKVQIKTTGQSSRYACTVQSGGKAQVAKGKIDPPPDMACVDLADPLAAAEIAHFKGRDQDGVTMLTNLHSITQVISMGMADQNIVHSYFLRVQTLCPWIAIDMWIQNQAFFTVAKDET